MSTFEHPNMKNADGSPYVVDAPEEKAAEYAEAGWKPTAAAVTDAGDVVEEPSGNATRAEWEAYAIARGAAHDDVKSLTRTELVSTYGTSA